MLDQRVRHDGFGDARMTYPGLGGQQPPPQNAAPAGQLVPGIQPGTTGVIVASRVIVIGETGGIFLYDGSGNLIGSWAAANGMISGQSYSDGLTVGPASGPQVVIIPGSSGSASEIQFPIPAPALSNEPNMAGAQKSATQAILEISGPGLAAAGDQDWVQIIMFSNDTLGNDATCQFRYVASGGGVTIVASYDSSGFKFNSPATFPGGISGNVAITGASTVTAAGAAVSAQSFTSAGDMSVQGSQLFVGNGTTAEVVLNPQQSVNAAATHIATTPTAAEFNSVVDLINSIRTAGINIGLWA
jgi:hypothetical protein